MFCARRVRGTAGILAIGAAVALLTAAPSTMGAPKSTGRSCAFANAPVGHAPAGAIRAAVVCLIDRERAHWRLPPLSQDRQLDRAAEEFANRLAGGNGLFAHDDPAARVSRAGYRWAVVGENIATGYPTADGVVRAWMASTGHCRNILDTAYRNVGVGFNPRPVRGAANRPGTWTVDFGRRLSQRRELRQIRPSGQLSTLARDGSR